MKLRIIRNATVILNERPNSVHSWIAHGIWADVDDQLAELDDDQRARVEAAIERGEDFVEV